MSIPRWWALWLALAAAPGACGKRGAPPAASAPAAAATPPAAGKAAPATPARPAGPAAPPPEIARILAPPEGKPGKPLSWREIVPLLPEDAGGWRAFGEPHGSSAQVGAFHIVEARREYRKDARSAQVTIVDTSQAPSLAQTWRLERQWKHEGSDRYHRPLEVSGQPALEEWARPTGRGKVALLVAERFLVTAEAGGLDDTRPLVELTAKLDLKKLAAVGR